MPSRRQFLISLGALTASGACASRGGDSAALAAPRREPEPADWPGRYPEDAERFPAGVQSGDATADSVLLSVRTASGALGLILMRAEGALWVEDRVLDGLTPSDGGLQIELDGLEADTAYAYTFVTPAGTQSPVGRFRTALGPEDWRVVCFAATSCLGGNEPWPSLSHAAAERPDFVLLLGDTVYADGAFTLEDYRAYWQAALATAGLRDMTAATSVIATWDDHEIANNFSLETVDPEQLAAGLQAFSEALPRRPGGGAAGIWRALSWGAVLDVFVLDCRSEREGEERFISQEQYDFLVQGLAASRARFKIIANPVPITDYDELLGSALAEDRWQGYAEQRAALLSDIRALGIEGVLFVSGDFHMGQLAYIDAPGGPGEAMLEVLAGPGGSPVNPVASLAEPDGRWLDFIDQYNTLVLEADPGSGTITLRFLGDDGGMLAEHVVAT